MAPVCLSSSIIGNSAFGKSSNTNFSCSHPSVFMSPWENIFLLSQSFFDVAEHFKKKKKKVLLPIWRKLIFFVTVVRIGE